MPDQGVIGLEFKIFQAPLLPQSPKHPERANADQEPDSNRAPIYS
jgi:hypothetical protein